MIVTLEQARAHLRLPSDYPSEQIEPYLNAAIDYCQQWLNRHVYDDTDALAAGVLAGTAGLDPLVVTPSIRAAVLLMLGHLFANRDAVTLGVITNTLPLGVTCLLQPYRSSLGV